MAATAATRGTKAVSAVESPSGLTRQLQAADLVMHNKVKPQSRDNYLGKIKYMIEYFEREFPSPSLVEISHDGKKSLILPLPFRAIKGLFGKIQVDTTLPRDAKKRTRESLGRREERKRIQQRGYLSEDE